MKVLLSTEVVYVSQLCPEVLEALGRGEILAIVVEDFVSPEVASLIAPAIVAFNGGGVYGDRDREHLPEVNSANEIGRLGLTCFEACGSQALLEEYYAHAQTLSRKLREICRPFPNPLDEFQLELRDTWPQGATNELLLGRKMAPSVARIISDGVEALPHQDLLWMDSPDPAAGTLHSQFAANVYVSVPPSGGELDLWGLHFDEKEFDRLRLGESYGLDRGRIEEPFASLRPVPGSLILFDSTFLHAVRAPQGCDRVTLSCFVGYRGAAEPLTYWA